MCQVRPGALRAGLPSSRVVAQPVRYLKHSALLQNEAHKGGPPAGGENANVGEIEPRLQLSFTCTVPDCNTRSTHEFTKQAYQNGVVLVQCPGCKNRYVREPKCMLTLEPPDR